MRRFSRPMNSRRTLAALGAVGLLLPLVPAHAATLATFEWINLSGTGSGTMSLTLPGTFVAPTFSVGSLTPAAALADLTAFSYTFSDGLTVGLSDLTTRLFTDAGGNTITGPTVSWATSDATHGGFGSGSPDLITGFIFSGNNSIAGGGISNYKISESSFSANNVGQASNLITPTLGSASNDAGYWVLQSLEPVPLPAGLPLLVSGLGMIGAMWRRRRAA